MKNISLLLCIVAIASCQSDKAGEQRKPASKYIAGLKGPVHETTTEISYYKNDSNMSTMFYKKTINNYYGKDGNIEKSTVISHNIKNETIDTSYNIFTIKNNKVNQAIEVSGKDTFNSNYIWESDYKYTIITKKDRTIISTSTFILNDSFLTTKKVSSIPTPHGTEESIQYSFDNEKGQYIKLITHKKNEPTKTIDKVILSEDNFGNITHYKSVDSATGKILEEAYIGLKYY